MYYASFTENIFVNICITLLYQSAGIITLTLLASSYAYYRGTILQWRWLESLRRAATLYSVITGVVFAVLVGSASPAAMIDHRTTPVRAGHDGARLGFV